MKKLQLAAVLLLLVASGCKKDDGGDVITPESTDQQLVNQLGITSNGVGVSYYKLPESTDYSNIPQDPKNPITKAKVDLGRMLFHESEIAIGAKYLDGVKTYSCASCHHAPGGFQACLQQGIGDGGVGFGVTGEKRKMNSNYSEDSLDVQPIRSPSILNTAYQEAMLWNGQFGATGVNSGTDAYWTPGTPKVDNNLGFQGLETQAIAGLNVHRMVIDSAYIKNSQYKAMFDLAFPNSPVDQRYSRINAGLAIAAFERTVLATQAPFQKWIKGDYNAMSEKEKRGALIFFGKGNCASCHNGPALSTMAFYALGMNDFNEADVFKGVDDATKRGRGGFTNNPADNYKFKVPQLYSLAHSPFYGHGGNFRSIREVIEYKNNAIKQNANVPDGQLASQFKPLKLTETEIDLLVAFLTTALDDKSLSRYEPSSLPSGNCFPNNDNQSKIDRGCN